MNLANNVFYGEQSKKIVASTDVYNAIFKCVCKICINQQPSMWAFVFEVTAFKSNHNLEKSKQTKKTHTTYERHWSGVEWCRSDSARLSKKSAHSPTKNFSLPLTARSHCAPLTCSAQQSPEVPPPSPLQCIYQLEGEIQRKKIKLKVRVSASTLFKHKHLIHCSTIKK